MRTAGLAITAALLTVVVSIDAQSPTSAPQPSGAAAGKPAAQRATPPRAAVLPRTPDGHPDFQGNWSNATITPLERLRPNTPLVLTEEAAQLDEKNTAAALEAREAPSDPNRGAPPVGGEVRKSPNAEPTYLELLWRAGGGAVGGYNSFWVDPGDKVLRVDGQPRSSIIIDPPNGRVPAYTADAQARLAKAGAARRAAGTEFDHPELRPLGERCITSFGNNAGPPMLPNYFYNNNYTIVQSKDTVVLLTEMVHDARVVRLNGTHPPAGMRKWFGDSIGRWEGDTLVIETTSFNPAQAVTFYGASPDMKVTERLVRTGERTILYQFRIEDPATFAEPWGGELPFNKMDELLYEYACHEGNYALSNVLSGARDEERRKAKTP